MTALVTLDPIAPRHANAVQRLASHPDVIATTNLPDPYPEDGAAQWIEDVQCRRAAEIEFPFAILNTDDTLVGVTGLIEVSGGVAELGYWVGTPYWGRGYATAANRRVLRFGFEELGLDKVFARPLERNAASRRVLDKLGFDARGTETHEHPKWTDDDRVVRYVLRRDQWAAGLSPSDGAPRAADAEAPPADAGAPGA